MHPTVEANGMLGRALVEPIVGAAVPELSAALARAEPAVREEVLARVDAAAHARAYKNLSKVLIWAGKKEEAAKWKTELAKRQAAEKARLAKAAAGKAKKAATRLPVKARKPAIKNAQL